MKKGTRPYDMTARAAKAEATRTRIRESAVDLYCRHPIEDFTLEAVAARAETTVQTVLRAFGSKDELIYAALTDMAAGGVFLKPVQPGDIKAAVTSFFDIYETVGDLVMRRLDEEQRRPALKASLDQGRENHRDGVKSVFAPQLEQRQGAARAQLLTMLTVLTDVYVWKLLRRDTGLGRQAAENLVRKMISGVIQQEQDHGTYSLAELVGRRQPAA
ncbi:MAG TPA: TetR/AcrR family transcriptional regulator [Xanthobacteraceae bacterium]|nr:TetR/AcrR family transcriptional regulator [Xanthobacteraceae bacterium]